MILQQFIADAQIVLTIKYGEREANAILYYLIQEVLGFSKTETIFHSVDEIAPEKETILKDAMERLQKNEPIQHITGWSYFFDLKFEVGPSVLIPRPETEELVDWIIHDTTKEGMKVLDIGTGSGCIAVTLAKHLKNASVTAIDVSAAACNIAKKNSLYNDLMIEVLNINILSNRIPNHKYNIIVSNPPYIPESEKDILADNVLQFEPNEALFVPSDDPLLFYKAIADFALLHLKRKGKLYFEIHENYGNQVIEMLREKGFKNIILKKDLQEKDRMIMAMV
ncbi:MAG: peptide chain release factor N(5)-glutamine methyltransferase [Bacteroidales bacterium]|nr:peptide chain release factor N(5)-glutamine methyltransferase [Bacteroidales bacterium]